MPVKGMAQAQRNVGKLLAKISGPQAERTMAEVLIIAQGYATLWAPADTGNLRNSQYRIISARTGGLRGLIGYTAIYAAAVHEASGKLKGKPRGKNRGNYWDPDGRPGFLRDAFEAPEPRAAIEAAIKRGMAV